MNKLVLAVALVLLAAVAAQATVHFEENFGSGWEGRWVASTAKQADGTQGKFELAGPAWSTDNKGLKTTEDARFYGTSASFPAFSNRGKSLVVQFTVQNTQNLQCGGAYLKVLGNSLDAGQAGFNGDSAYNLMVGPDVCGYSTKKTHFIIQYKGQNHLWKKDSTVKPKEDRLPHLYTFVLNADQTYSVEVDQEEVAKGSILEDWDLLPAKEIPDPTARKPSDWVDEAKIADASDVKPTGWDDIPKRIPDTSAKKPDDWDEDSDGAWEAPTIANPEYKGEWKAKQIDNPAYKGVWEHPKVPNPDYKLDDSIYAFDTIKYIGIDVWQVQSGSIFDNILITDSLEEAHAHGARVWKSGFEAEKSAYEAYEAKKKAEEEAAKPAAAADAEASNDKDEL